MSDTSTIGDAIFAHMVITAATRDGTRSLSESVEDEILENEARETASASEISRRQARESVRATYRRGVDVLLTHRLEKEDWGTAYPHDAAQRGDLVMSHYDGPRAGTSLLYTSHRLVPRDAAMESRPLDLRRAQS